MSSITFVGIIMASSNFRSLATIARSPSRTILYIFSVIIFCSSIDLGIASSVVEDRATPTPTVSSGTSTEKHDIPEIVNSNVLLHIHVSVTVQVLSTDRSNSGSSSNLFDPLLLDDLRSYIVTLDEYYDTNDAAEGQQMGHVSGRGLLQLEQSLALPWKNLNESTMILWRGSTVVSLLLPLYEDNRVEHTTTTRTFVAALWEDTIDQAPPQLLARRLVNTPSVAREFRNRKSRVGPYIVVSLAGTTSFQVPIDAKPENDTFGVTSKSYCLYEAAVSWLWWFSLVCFGFVATSVCYERFTMGDHMNPASGDPQRQPLAQNTTHELPVSDETNNSVDGVRSHPHTQKIARHTMPMPQVLKVQNDEASDGTIGVSLRRDKFQGGGPVSKAKAKGEFKAEDNDGCDTIDSLNRAQMPYEDESSENSDDDEGRISRPPIVVRQCPRLPVQHDLPFLASRPEGTRSSHSKLSKWTITPSAKIRTNPNPPGGPELVLGGAEEDSVTSPGNDTNSTVPNHKDNKIKTIVPNHRDLSKKQSRQVEHRNDESKEVAPQHSSQTGEELLDAATREPQREDYLEISNSKNFKSTRDERTFVLHASEVRTSQNEVSTGKECRSSLKFAGLIAPDEQPNKEGADPINGVYSCVSDETTQPAPPVVYTTSHLAEPANQPVKLNWLRRLRKRGEAHVHHFGSDLQDRQITKQTVIPPVISQRNHQGFSPACSCVSTLPPDSDASQDRPDLGLSKKNMAHILELEGNHHFADGKPSVDSSLVVPSTLLTSSSSRKRTTQQELPGASPNMASPVQKASTKHDESKEGLANSSPPKAGDHRTTRSMSLSRKRIRDEEEVVIIVNENSSQPPPASSSNRPGQRRRKRRRSIEEPILPDVVPSISLLNAAQNVRDPIWEFRSCAATSRSHKN